MELRCDVDVVLTAKTLKSLLCMHDRVVQKLTALDDRIDQINRNLLVGDLHLQTEQSAIRQQQLSVLNGMRQVLDKYRLQKLQEIQTLSRSVIQSLAPDTVTMETTSAHDLENTSVTMTMDMAAINYTTLSRECYRTE